MIRKANIVNIEFIIGILLVLNISEGNRLRFSCLAYEACLGDVII